MRVAALVPFKCFTRAKGRLRTRYSDREVEQLGHAMLADVLGALTRAACLERVTVLTDDPAVAEVARQARAAVRLRTPDPGLNPAIEDATRELIDEGFEAVVVVLGDVPLLQTPEVETVVDAGEKQPVVLVPSSDGGTSLLFRRPPDCIPACFGPDSAKAHVRAARERGLEPRWLSDLHPGTALDLDTPEDAQRLLETGVVCRTTELLRKFSR